MAEWLALGPFRTVLVPKAFFFFYSAGTVFLLPFVTILWRSFGFTEEMIGLLCALRPFVAAIGGSLIVSAADASQRHLAILLTVYVVAYLGRSLLAFFTGFAAQLAIALITEAAASPMGSLIDAAVMASATDEGGYGRIRMWASVGWGATAPLAGAVVAHFGLKAAFLCFTGVVGLTLLPTVLLPMEVLSKKQGSEGSKGDGGSAPPAAAGRDGARLSSLGGSSDKGSFAGGKGWGSTSSAAQEVEVEAFTAGSGGSLLSVHVSGGSQHRLQPAPALDRAQSGKEAAQAQAQSQAPLLRTWTIGAGRLLVEEGSPPPSPEQPLLSPSACSSPSPAPSPSPLPAGAATAQCSAGTTSSLELATAAPGCKTQPRSAAGACAAAGSVSVWQGVKGLLSDVHVVVFLLLAFLMGIGNGAIGYLFLFLDELGATGTLMGLCLSFNCAAEVPVFFFSGPILQRIGVERALQVAMGAYVVRLSCYLALPLLPTTWFVLPIELLQGLTFALAWSAGTVHVKRIAPPHLRGTVQSIFQGLYTGIGAGLGGLGGGLLYGSFGAAALFRSAAVALAAGWLGANLVLHVWGGSSSRSGHGAGATAGKDNSVRRAGDDESEDAALLQA